MDLSVATTRDERRVGLLVLCLLALGGYGRKMLFPYSDLDILFLLGSDKAEQESRGLISEFSRTLWDIGFRVSSAGRTLEECKRIEEDNAEFHLALFDRRFLAGDASLFEKLDTKVLPASEKQARPFLLAQIHRLTRERLTRYGNTIFHLEPNVKESPGGMRDYQATIWLRQIVEEKKGIRNITAAEEELSVAAVDFLSEFGAIPAKTARRGRNRSSATISRRTDCWIASSIFAGSRPRAAKPAESALKPTPRPASVRRAAS